MAIYSVAYDLVTPGKDYSRLIAALNAFDSDHAQRSLWMVNTSSTSAELRDHLGQFIDANDLLFVGEITSNWASLRMPRTAAWLKARGLG